MDLEIVLESEKDELIRATQFTLVGKLLTLRMLNRRG